MTSNATCPKCRGVKWYIAEVRYPTSAHMADMFGPEMIRIEKCPTCAADMSIREIMALLPCSTISALM